MKELDESRKRIFDAVLMLVNERENTRHSLRCEIVQNNGVINNDFQGYYSMTGQLT